MIFVLYVWINIECLIKETLFCFPICPNMLQSIRFVVQIHSEKKVVNFWRQKKHSGFIYTSLDFQYTLREFLISALLLNRLNTQRASTQYGLNGCYIPNVCLVLRSWNPVCLTNDFPGNLLMKKVLLCNAKKMGKWGGGVVEKMLRRYWFFISTTEADIH